MNEKNTFAYCAGYIDGDGCFHIGKTINPKTKSVKYKSTFIVSSTDQEILNFFCDHFGGICRLSSKRISSHKPQYHFILNGKNCVDMLIKISPYLVEKRQECDIFMKFLQSTTKEEKGYFLDLLRKVKHTENLITKSSSEMIYETINSIHPTEEDFSYLAGFIDAECCMGIQKYSSKNRPNFLYKIYLHCNNSKFPVFKWLTERFGGHVRFIDRNTKDPNQRNQLAWRVSSKSLYHILIRIHPFLKYKRAVCEELLKFYKTTFQNGGDRQSEVFKSSYSAVLQVREEIFNKIHMLNRKGILVA